MDLPKHVAIIMDGNGRWAKQRLLPRVAGHQQGVESVRAIIEAAAKRGIPYLTLFTFSSENWRRPESEIHFLFSLFLKSLKNELKTLHENQIRLKVIGDRSAFPGELRAAIQEAETLTQDNRKMQLNIAFNYGGRWDILEATRQIAEAIRANHLQPAQITDEIFAKQLALSDCPDPDLLIRTSGEYRISNFLLWQLAYTELYFTETYWPDFREAQFEAALQSYAKRQRRFGYSSEQLENAAKTTIDDPLTEIAQKIHA